MSDYFLQLEEAMAGAPSFDGMPARLVHLTNANGMSVSLMDIGATWLSCVLPVKGKPREVLLRSPDMREHMKQGAYFGSIVGRYANRIAKGQFTIGDHTYQVGVNNGSNSLHGGLIGFDKRRWVIESQQHNRAIFVLHSADGDQGYPGNLDIKVCYTLTDDNALHIDYYAEADQITPVNLTNHAYFNLAGENSDAKSIDHCLHMDADRYLPTSDDLIPTGELRAVAGTSFDFTQSKVIGRDFLSDDDQNMAGGYDHAFIFADGKNDGKETVVTLISPSKDVVMKVKTTKPAIQFYSGNFLAETPGASKLYQRYDGLALETQYFPDGPNHPEWGKSNGLLNCGEHYQHQTTYLFEF